MKDLIKYSDNKQKKKSTILDDLKYPIKAAIHQEQVKIYVNREAVLRSKPHEIYGIVWGQCYHGINSIILNS